MTDRDLLKEIWKKGICPFCATNFKNHGTSAIGFTYRACDPCGVTMYMDCWLRGQDDIELLVRPTDRQSVHWISLETPFGKDDGDFVEVSRANYSARYTFQDFPISKEGLIRLKKIAVFS